MWGKVVFDLKIAVLRIPIFSVLSLFSFVKAIAVYSTGKLLGKATDLDSSNTCEIMGSSGYLKIPQSRPRY